MPKPLGHIGSLKHVTELRLEAAPGGEPGAGDGATLGTARFVCPVTGLALNGKSRFVIFRKTGHVVSERALKEVGDRGAWGGFCHWLCGGSRPPLLLIVQPVPSSCIGFSCIHLIEPELFSPLPHRTGAQGGGGACGRHVEAR